MLARLEIARRWRGAVALALLVGAVGAIVLATAAGARRSDSALERFNTYSRSSDVEISIGTPTASQLRSFRRAPGVAAVAVAHGYSLVVGRDEGTAVAVPVDSALGNVVDAARLIKGRRADPTAPDEATIGEGLAAKLHLRVGSDLPAVSYSPRRSPSPSPVVIPVFPPVRRCGSASSGSSGVHSTSACVRLRVELSC